MTYRFTILIALIITFTASANELDPQVVELGRVLFHETRFSNPQSDMEVSCASCHADSDPLGSRAFTELFQRSWHPWRNEDPGRETLRNTPTLLDVGQHAFIHMDAEFATLEEQARATFTGRNFGWLPGEESTAKRRIVNAFEQDPALIRQFERAFHTAISDLSQDDLLDNMARATADFMRTLKSRFNSPYDHFIAENGIPERPDKDEDPKVYASKILERLYALETTTQLKLTETFGPLQLEGYKIFLRTEGRDASGNCVSCHVPPLFMDNTFHNTGVSQMEYDNIHGTGAFEKMEVPQRTSEAAPPSHFAAINHRRDSARVDLGHWNFARIESSPLRQPGDTPDSFFNRTIATFKTPTLRHLGSTDPYMHSGEFDYVEWALMQKVESAFLTRMNQMRNPSDEMKRVHITQDEFPQLVAFLNALNDAGERQIIEAPKVPIESYRNTIYRQE